MIKPPALKDEIARLKTLLDYQILDTPPEEDFSAIVAMASQFCHTPIAIIGLIDENRQWYKAKVGIDSSEADRDLTFCGHAIEKNEIMIVKDATLDERFKDNPGVLGGPKVRSYAGAPLSSPSGHNIGTLCVADSHLREFSKDEMDFLGFLAKQVMTLLEYRRAHLLMSSTVNDFRKLISELYQKHDNLADKEKLDTLGGLASGVAHEINNPLAIIVGAARAARKKLELNDLSDLREDMEIIEKSAYRMAGVIKELQKISELAPETFRDGHTIEEEFSKAVAKNKTTK